MQVAIEDQQQQFALNHAALCRVVKKLARIVRKELRVSEFWSEITLYLLDSTQIADVNRAVMGHAGSTDVITQSYHALPGEVEGVLGEIFVNVELANDPENHDIGWSRDHELALYIAHGVDHLGGGNDTSDADRAIMLEREKKWVRVLAIEGLFL